MHHGRRKLLLIAASVVPVMFLLTCANPGSLQEADLTVGTANLLWSNEKPAAEITRALMAVGADVLILNEVDTLRNLDCALLRENGYQIHFAEASTVSSNVAVVRRIDGVPGTIAGRYGRSELDLSIAPFVSLRVDIAGTPISIVGLHLPAPFYSDADLRDQGLDQLSDFVSNGAITADSGSCVTGDYAVVAGDFNCIPTDHRLDVLDACGLVDALVSARDKYIQTWSPGGLPATRIDYVFVSRHLTPGFQEEFEVPGSDHAGIVTGIDVP